LRTPQALYHIREKSIPAGDRGKRFR